MCVRGGGRGGKGGYHNVAEYPNKFYRFKVEKKSVVYNCKNVSSKHETQDLTQSSFLCLLAYSTMSSLC